MIVEKAVNMANMMKIPVLGIVENMSYALCPHCGDKIYLFGEGKTEQVALKYSLPILASVPIDAGIAAACDGGKAEQLNLGYMDSAADIIESGLPVTQE